MLVSALMGTVWLVLGVTVIPGVVPHSVHRDEINLHVRYYGYCVAVNRPDTIVLTDYFVIVNGPA